MLVKLKTSKHNLGKYAPKRRWNQRPVCSLMEKGEFTKKFLSLRPLSPMEWPKHGFQLE